ncbi:MAG TPA: hypothetical protein VJT31_22540, partial [Rugosimonospora sp.]|nr:hypothetical protein [Rugosimonospora sp.]
MLPTEGQARVQLADGQRWPRRVLVDAGLIAVAAGVTTLLVRTGAVPALRPAALDLSTAGAAALTANAVALLLVQWLHAPAYRA